MVKSSKSVLILPFLFLNNETWYKSTDSLLDRIKRVDPLGCAEINTNLFFPSILPRYFMQCMQGNGGRS